MGQLQGGVFQRNFAEEEDVDIDDAGGVACGVRFATEGALDGLGFCEEGERVGAWVVEVDDGVEESGGIRRAILRRGVVEGGGEEGLAGYGKLSQRGGGGGEIRGTIAEIGAEGDGDARQNSKL
jgi:hypothetical protein